jgi:hypothetical protein
MALLRQRSATVNDQVNSLRAKPALVGGAQYIEYGADRLDKKRRSLDELYEVYNAHLVSYLEDHLAPQCLAICEMMQEKLPREIRDQIYEYTIGIRRSRMDKRRDYEGVLGKQKPWSKSDPCIGWIRDLEKVGVLHICNIDFVGIDTLREIAETYYRTVTIFFDDYRVDEMVAPSLFGNDLWGFGMEVANQDPKLGAAHRGRYPRRMSGIG